MATTPNGLTYPTLTDQPNGPGQLQGLAESVDARYGLTVANFAALSGIASPFAGMRVWCTAEKIDATYDGSAWQLSADVFTGTEDMFLGSTPPAGTRKITLAGSDVITSNGSGEVGINYPNSGFPNGIVSVVATPGDSAFGLGQVITRAASCTLSHWQGKVYTFGGVLMTGNSVRVNYVAVGW